MKYAVYQPLAVVLLLSLVNGASPPSDQPAIATAGSKEEEATKSTKTAETRATSSSSSSSSSDDGDHQQQVLHHDDATAPSRRGSSENQKNDDDDNNKSGKITIKEETSRKEPQGGGSSSMDPETEEDVKKEEEPQRPSSSMHPDGTHIPKGEQRKKSETNRCWDYDLSIYQKGMICGPPLSYPCFDFGRCQPPPAGGGPTMYVYDYNCTLRDSGELSMPEEEVGNGKHLGSHWRKAASEAGILAETYDSACMFIHVNIGYAAQPCAVNARLWNNGVNHLMVDFSDITREHRAKVADSYAMEAASNIHTCFYRSGYDMSVPLGPNKVFEQYADTSPLKREFFLTTKASVYLSGHGSEERLSLVPLRNEADGVVLSLHCFELHQEHLLPENVEFCEELRSNYEEHDYTSLMNTTFGLVPAGRSPGTYRLGEVMSAGAIPVFVARDTVRPFQEKYDWPAFSFMFSPDQVGPAMMRTLRAVPDDKLEEMQRKSLEAYQAIFGGKGQEGSSAYDTIARNVVSQLRERVEYHRP